MVFTDGTQIGAVLDRNGLRPGRFWVTDDGLVVLASEAGVLDIDPAKVVQKGRLQPGKMFLADIGEHRLISDAEVKGNLAAAAPYGEWLVAGRILLSDLPDREHVVHTHASVTRRQQVFGYTEEELRLILAPMATGGAEPIGSMGTDTPVATLSEKSRPLFDYFSQLFAQVTNPPLDAIREELVTSLYNTIGSEWNLLDPSPASCRRLVLAFPVLDNESLAKILYVNRDGDLPGYASYVARGLYRVSGGAEALAERLDEICAEVSAAIAEGARIIILSDRHSNAELAPIPSLLLTSAVHHHLVREKTRTQVGLVVEAGDVREVHHVALLIGYGAAAVNPYLAIETVEDLARHGVYTDVEPEKGATNLIKALGKGVLKVMSKMGVSTVASYTGAQIFEALGLSQQLVDRYFTGTTSKLGGIGLDRAGRGGPAAAPARRTRPTASRWPTARCRSAGSTSGGARVSRTCSIPRPCSGCSTPPEPVATTSSRSTASTSTTRPERLMTLRGLLRFASPADSGREPVPIEEVEPVSEIVKRFSTGAMSYGSISLEAHQTLAIAMNRLGGKSNTGEGGEDVDRLYDPERRSAIKQVASGRFGVTSDYLTNASDIQIKMAQGAKPGEGGQLPGQKVYPWVAKTRHSTPGVGLISPPPHHDIYSIEDLKQLIHDLKCANPSARVHVKLVAEVGVGTVAAGVSKAKADVVLISGHDGGTGAAPLTSLKHAGGPWELGLAETQQTLLLNGLRDRIVVQVDGQLKTGRDVIIGALLGAEEYGFATAPLVVSGCIMMRVCHLDTCPVGVATQNEALRAKFSGKPEFVINFFEFVAQEVREYLAQLGFRIPGGGDRPRGGYWTSPAPRSTGRRTDSTWRRSCTGPICPRVRRCIGHRAGSRAGAVAGPAADRHLPAGAGNGGGDPGVGADPQRQPHRRHHPRPRGHQGHPRQGSAGRDDRHHLDRVRRAELRCLLAGGDHPATRGRQQRLPGQGTLRRAAGRATRPERELRRRGQHHRRQRDRLRGDVGGDLHPRPGGRAVLRPQLGCDRRGRGARRPRVRVHDRWTSPSCSGRPAATSRRACPAGSRTSSTWTGNRLEHRAGRRLRAGRRSIWS